MKRQYYVYIMSNKSRTLYTGVTNNLVKRLFQHVEGGGRGFTKRYHITQLVYYETWDDVRDAIGREKQIKGWRRSKKLELIESLNPSWDDLSREWTGP